MALTSPITGTFGLASVSEPIDPGILVALSLTTTYLSLQTTHLWCDAGISDEPFSDASRVLSLCSGYITIDHPLTWTGYLPISKASNLYLRVQGNLIAAIVATAHRLTKHSARFMDP